MLVDKVNETLFFSVRQVDWNNFDEWVEDRERKLQEGWKVIRGGYTLSVNRYPLIVTRSSWLTDAK